MKCKFISCLILMATFFISCAQSGSNENNQQNQESATISAASFKDAILKPGVQVLDVRTAGEFRGGHIQHALQANWLDQKEFVDRTQHLDKTIPIYIYCQSGGRSASAQSFLAAQGYKVINMEGGMSNWKMSGFPVEGAGNTPQMRIEDLQKTISSNAYVLVDIGAEWCPPCRKMLPVMEALKKNPAHPFYFLAVDGGNDIEAMQFLKSEGLPTFIIYKNGKEVWRHQGIVTLDEFNNALQ